MALTKERQGELFISLETLFWSITPVISLILITQLKPITSLSLSSLVSSIFFLLILVKTKKLSELKVKKAYPYIIISAVIIGILYHLLTYIGLQYTTANNAGIMATTEQFFAILYFGILTQHEKQTPKLLMGALFIFSGAIIILFKDRLRPNLGNLLILIGASMAPFASLAMKKARTMVSASTILALRSLITGIVLLPLALVLEPNSINSISPQVILLIIINGVFMLGLPKLLWVEGIHRIPISKAMNIASTAPALTMIFSYIFLHEVPSAKQIVGLIPILIGLYLITERKKSIK